MNHSSVIFQHFFLHSWYFQRWELNVEVVFEDFFSFQNLSGWRSDSSDLWWLENHSTSVRSLIYREDTLFMFRRLKVISFFMFVHLWLLSFSCSRFISLYLCFSLSRRQLPLIFEKVPMLSKTLIFLLLSTSLFFQSCIVWASLLCLKCLFIMWINSKNVPIIRKPWFYLIGLISPRTSSSLTLARSDSIHHSASPWCHLVVIRGTASILLLLLYASW